MISTLPLGENPILEQMTLASSLFRSALPVPHTLNHDPLTHTLTLPALVNELEYKSSDPLAHGPET